MSAALTDIADLAMYPPFVRRVTAATIMAAVTVGAETYDGSQYRIMRRALSTQVLKNADTWGAVCAWGVAANPTITAASSDTDIAASVTALWDAIAGAYAETSTNPTNPTNPPAGGSGTGTAPAPTGL